MNNLDRQYTELLQDILDNGTKRQDRTGTGTLSVFGRQIRHRMSEGFPLVTTKKMAFKTMVTELLWFLRGDTNIKYLVDNDCHIWDGDAYKGYETQCVTHGVDPMSKEQFISAIKLGNNKQPHFIPDLTGYKLGDLGPIYGAQWRSWRKPWWEESELSIASGGILGGSYYKPKQIDQIANLINELKNNPDSRRLMVNAWNVGELDKMVLPPCHYGFQVYTRELKTQERMDWLNKNNNTDQRYRNVTMDELNVPKRAISLMYNVRSQDVGLGWSFNVSSYALLLIMIAKQVNMVPDELIMNMGDCHIYLNHIDGLKEQIGRDLTDEERYNIWFDNNYETGMERYFDPNNLPNFDDDYYVPTPKRTREPYPLPTLKLSDRVVNDISEYTIDDIILENYKCHPAIKLPLSN